MSTLENGKQNCEVFVVMSDWCPVCLEYKAILSKAIVDENVKIYFIPPDKIAVNAIPTTFFVNNGDIKQVNGFIAYDQFISIYFEFG